MQRGADGAFHVHATSDDWGDGAGRRLVPHFRSFDLVEWEYVGDAFAAPPAWAPAGSSLWAPDVHLTDAGAVMYYTTGGAAPCIGRATAPGPDGPWAHDAAPIVCYGADEPYQDLDPMDPEVVVTEAGPVMFMGNFEGVHAVPMNAAGTALAGDPVLVAGPGVEAPAVVARGGRTHLFTSAGLCCDGERSRYRVLGGRADDLLGPYEDRSGRPCSSAARATWSSRAMRTGSVPGTSTSRPTTPVRTGCSTTPHRAVRPCCRAACSAATCCSTAWTGWVAGRWSATAPRPGRARPIRWSTCPCASPRSGTRRSDGSTTTRCSISRSGSPPPGPRTRVSLGPRSPVPTSDGRRCRSWPGAGTCPPRRRRSRPGECSTAH
ncbi:putative endo-1,5-alpha-L-arabinanase [Dietzia cinnamea P4]|nr:putative endo-1,5-alpha-L-arabinanase [Dietzia cinnamea P4]